MAKTDLFQFDSTAANNTDINSVDVDENCNPSGINNAIRQLMAYLRDYASTVAGGTVSSGTDTVTLATAATITAYADGMSIGFIAGGTNTGAATLNVDSVGAKKIFKGNDTELAAGDIITNQPCLVFYDASADSASGAWKLLNPALTGLQTQGDVLDDLNTLGTAASDGEVIVATGAGAFAYESGATARASLGLTIGTDVQAFHAYLADIAGITAAQGDIIYFDGTDWVNLGPGTAGQYLKTQGAAADPVWATISTGCTFIASTDASSSSEIDFDSVASEFDGTTYDGYLFVLQNIIPATDAQVLRALTSSDGGASFDTTATDYRWAYTGNDSAGIGGNDQSDGHIELTEAVGSGANEDGISGTVTMAGPHLSKYTRISWELAYVTSGGDIATIHGAGERMEAGAVDGLRFIFASGNIESGTITMYGLNNS